MAIDQIVQSKLHLIRYYEIYLKRFKLHCCYSAEDIFQEVIVKAELFLKKGETIHNPIAWAKRVGCNLIVDRMSEEAPREPSYFERFHSEHPAGHDDCISEKVRLLQTALQKLKIKYPHCAELIEMRFFQNLSWKDIAALHGTSNRTNVDKWRKRGERAIDRLRIIFLEELNS